MFDFTLDATSGPARAGTLTLPHGTVETPVASSVKSNMGRIQTIVIASP